MDDIEETLLQLGELKEAPCCFLNQEEAKQFMNSCEDPIVRDFLWNAYATFLFKMAPNAPDGQFDVLFFTRVLAEMLNDRARLLRVLSGDLTKD